MASFSQEERIADNPEQNADYEKEF